MCTFKLTLAFILTLTMFSHAALADDAPREIIFESEDIEGELLAPIETLDAFELDREESLVEVRDSFIDLMIQSADDL